MAQPSRQLCWAKGSDNDDDHDEDEDPIFYDGFSGQVIGGGEEETSGSSTGN